MFTAIWNACRFPRVAFAHRDILGAFVARDMKSRYEGSLLGRLWPLLHPLLLLGVYSVVFTQMLQQDYRTPGAEPLVASGWVTTFFLLTAILPWGCTNEGVARSCPVVIENNNLIKKVAFPSELLPTYTVAVSFVQMLIGFGLFIPVYIVVMLVAQPGSLADRAAPLWHLALLPAPLLLHFIFVVGLGMLLAALNVFVRDINNFLPLALSVWMFFSPIWYRIDRFEQAGPAWLVTAMKVNPLYHLLALYRGVFVYEKGAAFPFGSLGIFSAIAVGVFVLGHACFHKWKGLFPDEV